MTTRSAISKWLVEECARTIDLKTGKPITWRQASIQAGFSPGAFHNWIQGRTHPDPESCTKIALFFSTAERVINPDYLMWITGHRLYEAPEFLIPAPPQPAPLTDEEADAILAAALGEELYALLAEMISTPQGREELKWHLRRVLGK